MNAFVKEQLGRSNEEPSKKRRVHVNSSSKLQKRSGLPDAQNPDSKNVIAPPIALPSNVKREVRGQNEMYEQHYHGAFDTDTESIGDTTTNSSMLFAGRQQEISRQARQQEQPILDSYSDDEGNKQRDDRFENARALRQQYPDDFETDEQALDMLESGRVLQIQDGQFAWFEGAESYPTTTSGRWEDDDIPVQENGLQDAQYQHSTGKSDIEDETQHFDVGPQHYTGEINHPRLPTNNEIESVHDQPRSRGNSDLDHRQRDVYHQVRQQAGVPQRIAQRESRPITPHMPTKTAEQVTPRLTPYKHTTEIKHPIVQARAPSAEEPTPGQEHDQLQLDFQPPDLYAKSYNDLKRMPFDNDPHAADPVLHGADQAKPLAERLVQVSALPPDPQADFLAGLDLDDWEDAGDWFVAQFSQILQRLKDARREKRRLAISFEDEIEKRHETVSRRRSTVEGALKEMRMSGAAVLQGTPKKSTKK
ncbi:MAG: hypothetical protein Q9165_005288 [Trypethelium subeluteriae]